MDENWTFDPSQYDPTRAGELPPFINPPKIERPVNLYAEYPLMALTDVESGENVPDFVEGVLVLGSLHVVYGQSHAGKTWWALDIAMHVAAGLKWRDRAVEQGTVVYLSLEGSSSFKLRVDAWCRHFDPERKAHFAMIEHSINFCELSDIAKLINTLKTAERNIGPVKLVVVDTLARAMAGKNENSPEDLGLVVSHCNQISKTCGAAVLLIHHSGKDEAKGARGHSLLRAATDIEIEIVGNGSDEKSANVKKHRDFGDGVEFPFKVLPVQMGKNRRDKPLWSAVIEHLGVAVPTPGPKKHERRSPKKMVGDAQLEACLKALKDCLEFARDKRGVQKMGAFRESCKHIIGCDNAGTFNKQFTRQIQKLLVQDIIEMDADGWIKLKGEPVRDIP
jgi:hypothetical protein